MKSYLHLEENIDQDAFVICDYRVTTDMPMEKAAEAIAAEQSTGTWTGISTLTDDIFDKYGGRVIKIDKEERRIGLSIKALEEGFTEADLKAAGEEVSAALKPGEDLVSMNTVLGNALDGLEIADEEKKEE